MHLNATPEDPAISSSRTERSSPDAPDAVEWAARAGYVAKGVVYAVIGGLAAQQALGAGGETTGSTEALERIASAPFGQIALGVVAIGLAGYTLWRLVQALFDPEGEDGEDDRRKRWVKRAMHLISAGVHGMLTYVAATLVLGSGGGSEGGSGGSWAGDLMSTTWGLWLVGAIGAGIAGRGLMQLVKAYTKSFKDKISSFDLGPVRGKWVIRTSQFALTARGVVFGILGGSVIRAAATHDPEEAEGGLEGALDSLVAHPWLLGVVALGLIAYSVYQGVKARYRIIGV